MSARRPNHSPAAVRPGRAARSRAGPAERPRLGGAPARRCPRGRRGFVLHAVTLCVLIGQQQTGGVCPCCRAKTQRGRSPAPDACPQPQSSSAAQTVSSALAFGTELRRHLLSRSSPQNSRSALRSEGPHLNRACAASRTKARRRPDTEETDQPGGAVLGLVLRPPSSHSA